MNISLIVFGYNEAGNISRVIEEALHFLQSFAAQFEIIVVNDGSQDETGQLADDWAHRYPEHIFTLHHPVNLGIGMALRSGYQRARLDYVCAVPADGQFDIRQLHILQPFAFQQFYSFYRLETRYNTYRWLLTWTNRLLNQHILGIFLRDVNWIKVYRKDQLVITKPELNSSLIESEICAKLYRLGVMPIEIPSAYLERKSGKAKGGNWNTLQKAIRETGKLFWVVICFKTSK